MEKIKQREERKKEHLRLSLAMEDGPQSTGLEDVRLVHSGISPLSLEEIDLSVNIYGKQLKSPLYINAITGGAEGLEKINGKLATIAKECGIAIAVGSQKAAIHNPMVRDSFEVVRKNYPDGLIMANISANSDVKEGLEAIEMIQADMLQLHVNLAQEIAMQEGERDFRQIEERIYEMTERSPVPVVIKEVGFGLSYEVVKKLNRRGIEYFDIGGAGGTNFIAIEQGRSGKDYSHLLDWGIPTAYSLLEGVKALEGKGTIFASGGIRTSTDVIKCLVIGANVCGLARPVLEKVVGQGIEGGIRYIQEIEKQMKEISLLLGAKNIQQLKTVPFVLTGHGKQWMEGRGLWELN